MSTEMPTLCRSIHNSSGKDSSSSLSLLVGHISGSPRLREVLRRSDIAWPTAIEVARDGIANRPEISLQRAEVTALRPTLLAHHLAYKLSPQPETVANEALGRILHSSGLQGQSCRNFCCPWGWCWPDTAERLLAAKEPACASLAAA